MSKDEALRLALEVLQDLEDTQSYWWQEVDEVTLKQMEPAITAIKAALEAKDEPVGVVATDTSKTHLYYGTQYLGQKTDTKMVMLFKDLPLGTPVYTTPPQRKPLTDEQIYKIYRDCGDLNVRINVARAIEAAHGIKGEA